MSRRRDEPEQGAATVEFVLVFPLALALIALVLFAGWLGLTQVILEHGAREGARAASIPVASNLRAYPDDAQLAVLVDEATPLISPTGVTSSVSGTARNAPVEVTVTYQVANPVAALLSPLTLLGFENPAPSAFTLEATSRARRE